MLRWTAASAVILSLTLPAKAWEVVSDGLPTFAMAAPLSSSGYSSAPTSVAGVKFEAIDGWNSGYSYKIGGKYLFGFEQQTGLAAGADLLGLASGFDVSRSRMKLGYDFGAFRPFMSASFSNVTAPAFGANLFAGPPGAANPFAPTASATTLGAGFDYAISDKLSIGVSVNATQTSGWSR